MPDSNAQSAVKFCVFSWKNRFFFVACFSYIPLQKGPRQYMKDLSEMKRGVLLRKAVASFPVI